MKYNFNTAEDFKSLPEEERLAIVKEIANEGYKADIRDYTDFAEEREVFKQLQQHYKRIELLAYAIGDELLAYRDSLEDGTEEYEDADNALLEFMSSAAQETEQQYEQQYCGDYYSHEDGFWIPSTC